MQKRIFNTTGYCNPDKHYTINPLRHVEEEIYKLIEQELYFVIHAPRQTGKTTLLHNLAKRLNKEGKYISLVFSIERAGYRSISHDEANKVIINSIHTAAKNQLNEKHYPPNEDLYAKKDFYSYLSAYSSAQNKPIVLLIDEIDALYDDVLVSVLRQLRDGFQSRPKHFPQSIALVGLRDVRDYKERAKETERSIGSGSPFNIKAESFRLPNFSKEEIRGLYQQYTNETGQKFPEEVIDLIYDYTDGQPWLTNAVAREMTQKILKEDYKAKITPEIARQAKENLILRRDTHLDSLIDKLQDERVKPIIQSVINGEPIIFDNLNDSLQYCFDLGIITNKNKRIEFANQIYREIIPRVLNYGFQESIANQNLAWYITKDGNLDMDALLKEFQDFYRENSESWIERFNYKEAGHQLLLMAFLQRVLNGGGNIEREMAVGSGRTDLIIDYNKQRFVLELKIKRNERTIERGLKQLSRYLDTLKQKHGYMIVFEPKPSSEIPWENRIKWTKTDYEHQGIKRKITLVEM